MRGRKKRDFSNYQAVKLEPEITHCPKCGQRLHFCYRSNRHVAFLDQRKEIIYDVLRCPNPDCEGPDNRHVAPEVHSGTLRKFEVGLDVIAFIGHQRLKNHATFAVIGKTLRQEYAVPISDRRVQDLFDVYLALASANIAEDPDRLAKLRVQGKIILALDAAQPEADGESLWVLRDTLSGEILTGFTAPSMDADTLAGHLRNIKALGIPLTGVISDAQNFIIKAVGEVFPDVPYQLCQIHFLKNFAKKVTAADAALKNELGKHLRGLASFERAATENPPQTLPKNPLKAPKSVTLSDEPAPSRGLGRPRTRVRLKPPRTPEERALVRDVCEILRAILKSHGRYPLKAPGLETRDMLHKLLEALDEGIKKGGPDFSSCDSSASMSKSR